MDIRAEIDTRVARLSADMQEEVLRFVSSLEAIVPKGQSGAALRRFAGSLHPDAAREMTRAIDEACERVDAGEW